MTKSVNKTAATKVDPKGTEVLDPMASYVLKDLMTEYKTKSATIRFLTSEGQTRSNIAKFMNIRYQHVRNVQVQDIEKAKLKAQATK